MKKINNQSGIAPVMILVIALVVVAVVGGAVYVMNRKKVVTDQLPMPTPTVTPLSSGAAEKTVTETPAVKEFTVVGTPYKFSLTEITVKKGDLVRIIFKNDGGKHDWVVDEFNARTKVIDAGQTDTIEFVADKAGTFEYYCSVMQHRKMGMVGKLIVGE